MVFFFCSNREYPLPSLEKAWRHFSLSSSRALNEKVLYLIDSNGCNACSISPEDIYNAYTGDGRLHGLDYFYSFYIQLTSVGICFCGNKVKKIPHAAGKVCHQVMFRQFQAGRYELTQMGRCKELSVLCLLLCLTVCMVILVVRPIQAMKADNQYEFPDCEKLQSLRMFKNGRVDMKFASEACASQFIEEYMKTIC
mgnify:CR=1 FL=1